MPAVRSLGIQQRYYTYILSHVWGSDIGNLHIFVSDEAPYLKLLRRIYMLFGLR